MKQSNLLRLLLLVALVAFSAGTAMAPAAGLADSTPTRIRFERGTTNAEVSGKLAADSSIQYVLRAAAGQLMEVSLSAPEGASLEVTTAGGRELTPVKGTSGDTGFRGYLPRTGDYLLTITSSDEAIQYSVYVSIPVRVSFDRGMTSDSVEGSLDARQSLGYILRAGEGQILEINVDSEDNASTEGSGEVQLVIYGVDGTVLRSGMGEGSTYRGELPESQDYLVSVRAGEQAVEFTMDVIIPQQIRFRSGAFSGSVWTDLPAHRTQYYSLRAREGQTMKVKLSNSAGLDLVVYGADGEVLEDESTEGKAFEAELPSTQDYILAVSTGSKRASYRLKVTIR